MRAVLLTWAVQSAALVLAGRQLADIALTVSATSLPPILAAVTLVTGLFVLLTLIVVDPDYRTWALLAVRGLPVPAALGIVTAWSVLAIQDEIAPVLTAAMPWFAGSALGMVTARWLPVKLGIPSWRGPGGGR